MPPSHCGHQLTTLRNFSPQYVTDSPLGPQCEPPTPGRLPKKTQRHLKECLWFPVGVRTCVCARGRVYKGLNVGFLVLAKLCVILSERVGVGRRCVCARACRICACRLTYQVQEYHSPLFSDFSFCLQLKKTCIFAPTSLLKAIHCKLKQSLFYFQLQQLATSPEVGSC